MKKSKLLSVVSLLLVLVLSFASCGEKPGSAKRDYDPEAAVTVEPKLENFIKFNFESFRPSWETKILNKTYGEVVSSVDDYTVFRKESKDYLNNLTEEYTIYSLEECKVVTVIKNTYPDEFNGTDEHGNPYRPAKTLDVRAEMSGDTVYFVAKYTCYTPIDEEIIEDEELDHSYSESFYADFYDVSGTCFATSTVTDRGEFDDGDDHYDIISFGKTVGIFRVGDSSLVKVINGETNKIPLPDYVNDKYCYYLDVNRGVVDSSFYGSRGAIQVYDFDGNLVLDYNYSYREGVQHNASVLDNGDILLQTVAMTDSLEYDIFMMGQNFVFSTYIIDVETGSAKEVDFDYVVNDVMTRADFLKEMEEENIGVSDYVRNVGMAIKVDKETKTVNEEEILIFFDSLLNINFEYTGELEYGASMFDDYTVLKGGYLLMDIENGATERAIFTDKGEFVCYVPDDAIVAEDIIINGETVFDLKMNKICDLNMDWANQYENINYKGTVGTYLVFDCSYITTVNDYPELRHTVQFIGTTSDSYSSSYSNMTVSEIVDGFAILYDYENNEYNIIIDGAQRICTVNSYNIPSITEFKNSYVIEAYTSEGTIIMQVVKTSVNEKEEEGGHEKW